MNYGLYMAASGMSASMARQNVLSNNLANVSTVGYKPDSFAIRQRAAARQEDGLHWMDSNAMLERLGAGVQPTFSRVEAGAGAADRIGESAAHRGPGRGLPALRASEPGARLQPVA